VWQASEMDLKVMGGGKLKDMTGRGQAFKNIDKHKTERLLKYPFLQPFYKFSFSQLLPQK
jgi:hypothetical protein